MATTYDRNSYSLARTFLESMYGERVTVVMIDEMAKFIQASAEDYMADNREELDRAARESGNFPDAA